MGLWDKMQEPVFLKESSDAQKQIRMLEGLASRLTVEGQEILQQDIRFLEYGIQGERQIAYELKNSHMPMYVLHDIYLEDGELSAQIDYIVVTRKICFIIECKNLYGDIEIAPSGEFYRMMEINGRRRTEAIYSPITQNEHHLELLKKIRLESKGNFLFRRMAEKQFYRCHQPIVVLTNPRTRLYAQNTDAEIRQKVIRADQLVAYIRKQYQLSAEAELSDKKLTEWAETFLDLHQEKHKNYLRKYQPYLREDILPPTAKAVSVEDTPIFKTLRVYRWNKSQEEGIKPYLIYNDNQLKDLIAKRPRNLKELQQVSGFGEIKAKKYGADILSIIRQFQDR